METLQGWGLLLLTLAVLGLGFLGWRACDRQSVERQAAAVIDEAGSLLQRLGGEKRAVSSFAGELAAARESLEEAQARFSAKDFQRALDNGQRSRNVLLSILDALSPRGSAGQAQFISIQGEVEYRRGDGGAATGRRRAAGCSSSPATTCAPRRAARPRSCSSTARSTRCAPTPSSSSRPAARGQPGGAVDRDGVRLGQPEHVLQVHQQRTDAGAVARVKQDSEAFVSVDKGTSQGRFGAFRGGMELASKGGLTREVGALQQVVQTGDLLSEPKPLPGRPELVEPADNLALDLEQTRRLVLAWDPVPGASRYALQISRNHLFVDNVIDAGNRTKTRATLGLRGEGAFQWRVAAYGQDGLQGPWSEPRKFRVASSRTASGEKKDTIPPELDLEDVKSYGSIFIVAGSSEPGARVEINGEQVKTGADGAFTKTVQLTKEGWSIIEVRARDAWGNETVRRHRVFVENP